MKLSSELNDRLQVLLEKKDLLVLDEHLLSRYQREFKELAVCFRVEIEFQLLVVTYRLLEAEYHLVSRCVFTELREIFTPLSRLA